jgi:hypothetical protein
MQLGLGSWNVKLIKKSLKDQEKPGLLETQWNSLKSQQWETLPLMVFPFSKNKLWWNLVTLTRSIGAPTKENKSFLLFERCRLKIESKKKALKWNWKYIGRKSRREKILIWFTITSRAVFELFFHKLPASFELDWKLLARAQKKLLRNTKILSSLKVNRQAMALRQLCWNNWSFFFGCWCERIFSLQMLHSFRLIRPNARVNKCTTLTYSWTGINIKSNHTESLNQFSIE